MRSLTDSVNAFSQLVPSNFSVLMSLSVEKSKVEKAKNIASCIPSSIVGSDSFVKPRLIVPLRCVAENKSLLSEILGVTLPSEAAFAAIALEHESVLLYDFTDWVYIIRENPFETTLSDAGIDVNHFYKGDFVLGRCQDGTVFKDVLEFVQFVHIVIEEKI